MYATASTPSRISIYVPGETADVIEEIGRNLPCYKARKAWRYSSEAALVTAPVTLLRRWRRGRAGDDDVGEATVSGFKRSH